jgi:hypothetical protein
MDKIVYVYNAQAAGQGRAGEPEWIGTGEASRMLQVSPRTVRRWVRDGWLSGRWISPDRRRLQVRARELVELLAVATSPGLDAR